MTCRVGRLVSLHSRSRSSVAGVVIPLAHMGVVEALSRLPRSHLAMRELHRQPNMSSDVEVRMDIEPRVCECGSKSGRRPDIGSSWLQETRRNFAQLEI
jgi:hypothetical protein